MGRTAKTPRTPRSEGERGNGEVGRGTPREMSFRPERSGVEESLRYWSLQTGNWKLAPAGRGAVCRHPRVVSGGSGDVARASGVSCHAPGLSPALFLRSRTTGASWVARSRLYASARARISLSHFAPLIPRRIRSRSDSSLALCSQSIQSNPSTLIAKYLFGSPYVQRLVPLPLIDDVQQQLVLQSHVSI
jgi:hypothetical protein